MSTFYGCHLVNNNNKTKFVYLESPELRLEEVHTAAVHVLEVLKEVGVQRTPRRHQSVLLIWIRIQILLNLGILAVSGSGYFSRIRI